MVETNNKIREITLERQPASFARMGEMIGGGAAWAAFLEEEGIIGHSKFRLFVETSVDIQASASLALAGYYRQSILILRSWLEIIFRNVYFVDHPVELELWLDQRENAPGFHELVKYLFKLPQFRDGALPETYKSEFENLYRSLSKAVHGVGIEYERGLAWTYDEGFFNQWFQYLEEVFTATSLVLLLKFRDRLARRGNFREEIKDSLGDQLLLELRKLGYPI